MRPMGAARPDTSGQAADRTGSRERAGSGGLGVVVVMPAYNAAQTLEATYKAIPEGAVDHIILVDDCSKDDTLAVAHSLDITTFKHDKNYGYGANQKTCYAEALKTGFGIVVMLHPDYQYDPTLLPTLVKPIADGQADVVLGSRVLGSNPVKQGMPWWKYVANRALTGAENAVFGLQLSEYHTGYRAYSRQALEAVNFKADSDGFVFDQDIMAQFVAARLRIHEVPVPTRYFPEASSASFRQSSVYGLSILRLLGRYLLHRWGIRKNPIFETHHTRYERVTSGGAPVG